MAQLTAKPEEESGLYEETDGLCGCLHLFGSKKRLQTSSNGAGDHAHLLGGESSGSSNVGSRKSWLVEKLMKAREMSEMVAGPKWKTLVRKIGGYFTGNNNKRNKDTGYDSYDYALNFDEGLDEDDDRYNYNLGFSARFAAPFPDKKKAIRRDMIPRTESVLV